MRMRTIKEAHDALVAADPGCCLTMTALRRKVVSGEVPSVRAGTKYLVDLDKLEQALFTPIEPSTGTIRPVDRRAN